MLLLYTYYRSLKLRPSYIPATPCSDRPSVLLSLGSDPLIAVEPSLTLPTVPLSRHRLMVKVKSNPLLVDLDLILSSPTDLTVGVPLAGTPPPGLKG